MQANADRMYRRDRASLEAASKGPLTEESLTTQLRHTEAVYNDLARELQGAKAEVVAEMRREKATSAMERLEQEEDELKGTLRDVEKRMAVRLGQDPLHGRNLVPGIFRMRSAGSPAPPVLEPSRSCRVLPAPHSPALVPGSVIPVPLGSDP